ncbi:MAG: hypothetical protein Tsb0014_36300 [Pleurocapsa sp.]
MVTKYINGRGTGTNQNDYLYGGYNDDTITGLDGNDTLRGDGGNDRLNGNAGNDKLYGGYNDDYLSGSQGNDTLYGESNNDTLYGGALEGKDKGGYDHFYGGQGNDTFQFYTGNPKGFGSYYQGWGNSYEGNGYATIHDYSSVDTIKLTGTGGFKLSYGNYKGGYASDTLIRNNKGDLIALVVDSSLTSKDISF